MNHELWNHVVDIFSPPTWLCPVCGAGTLIFVDKSYRSEPDSNTRRGWGHESWDPSCDSGYFSCLLRCANAKCEEPVLVAGRYKTDEVPDQQYGSLAKQIQYPVSLIPPPSIISIPDCCPSAIADIIKISFSLYWMDPGAAANKLRLAIERYLDYKKIRKTGRNRKDWLTTHHRIIDLGKYSDKNKDKSDILLAIKWIGNTGSHNELSRKDVLDAYEMLEHVLALEFSPKNSQIQALAKKINKKKGPVKP